MFNRFYKIAVGIPAVLFLLVSSVARAASVKVSLSAGETVQLLTDDDGDGLFEPFFIQGVGYSPVPIGRAGVQWGLTNIFDDEEILRRDFQLLQDMHANTIRLWKADNTNNTLNEFPNYLTARTLDLAQEYNLKVIPGFWIEMGGHWQCGDSGREFVWDESFFDLENKQVWPSVKTDILKRWRAFVTEFKDHPAILFWVIGNENNLRLGKDAALVNAFYALVNEMAVAAHAIDVNHPVAFVNGGIEVPVVSSGEEMNAFGQIITATSPAVDIWGVNAYPGNSFGDLFETFHEISGGKPLWISEFGIDAWHSDREDAEGGYEDQDTQAVWAAMLWDEIAAAKDFGVIGATAMEYADEWWKPYQWMCQVPGWTQWWRPWWELDNDAGE
ncbi:MAG TPA: glycoside hydrolase family 2 TIM barrel-domain containing protein, partial [Candidatus Bathyarchaeia archaeon]|nr:glycoside hydrolase family 2 TIM barrel-domain containing protein [Candidatus Bathyarchaeia archaeon]